MTRLPLPLLLIALAAPAASAPAAPVPDEAKAPVLFYPTTVGTKWVYQHPVGEETHLVTAVERKGDSHVVSVGKFGEDGTAVPFEKLEVSGRGVIRMSSVAFIATTLRGGGIARTRDSVAGAPPFCLLKLPSQDGIWWPLSHPSGRPVTGLVGREEAVRVPAGTFTAVPVDYVLAGAPDMPASRARHWYAPGVGVVKKATTRGEVVLKAFSPGRH